MYEVLNSLAWLFWTCSWWVEKENNDTMWLTILVYLKTWFIHVICISKDKLNDINNIVKGCLGLKQLNWTTCKVSLWVHVRWFVTYFWSKWHKWPAEGSRGFSFSCSFIWNFNNINLQYRSITVYKFQSP